MKRSVPLLLLTAFLLVFPADSFAARKRKGKGKGLIAVGDGQVYDVTVDGKTLSCLFKNEKIKPVFRKKKADKVQNAGFRYKKQKEKAGDNTKKKRRINKKQKAHKQACLANAPGNGGGPGGGGGGGGGTAPVCSSMALSTKAITEADFVYLFKKAGYGLGAREKALMANAIAQHGLTQNAYRQVVDQWVEPVSDTAEKTLRIQAAELVDEDPGSTRSLTLRGLEMAQLFYNTKTQNSVQARMTLAMLGIFTQGIETLDQVDYNVWWNYLEYWRNTGLNVDFREVLEVITNDPGMCKYLDNCVSQAGAINENYARELMELFTLGPIHLDENGNEIRNYSDEINGSVVGSDIWNMARALTGFALKDVGTGKMSTIFVDGRHDNASVPVFQGQPWQTNVNDLPSVITAILDKHPEASRYYARELLKEFGTPKPTRASEVAFGERIKAHNYKLKPAFVEYLKSQMFLDCTANRGTVIKDPQHLAIEFIRTIGAEEAVVDNPNTLRDVVDRQLASGLAYSNPPTVFWYNKDLWVTTGAYLSVLNAMSDILTEAIANGQWDPTELIPNARDSSDAIAALERLFGAKLSVAQVEILEKYFNFQYVGGKSVQAVFQPKNSGHVALKVPAAALMISLLPSNRQV